MKSIYKVKDGSDYELSYEVIPNVLPETTLFLHGNVASSRWWYPTRDILQKRAQGKDFKGSMILGNFRGCGDSLAPREQDINMEVFAQDYISLIDDLQLGPVQLVGHSAGGLIAVLMLAKAPSLFKKALLLDPVGADGVQFEPSMGVAFEMMKNDKALVATVIGSTIYKNNPDSNFFKSMIVEDAFHAVKTMGAGVIKALHRFNMRPLCSGIKHNVLVLHGEHDVLLPMKDSKELAALLPNACFEVISGHGHCVNVENPEAFVKIFDRFFEA